ncbi:MAG: ABC transporter permease [Dehalococcoidia bacterium]|nr:ABC transporter permease [Dehalococcoidia bacterium]
MNEGIAFEAQLERQQRNRLLQVWIVFRRWPVIPLFILAVMAIFAIFAPWIAPNEPLKQSLPLQYVPPVWATEERSERLEGRVDSSFEYFLGTDNLGRDILSRIIYGARISLMVALVSLTSGILVGSTLGLIGGWYGGIVDELVARLVDIWYALPFLLVALVVVIVLGQTLVVMMFVLALTAWSPFVRNVRAEVLSLKERDYVALAKVAGASPFYIMYKHILPGVINTIVVIATLNVGGLILAEATLTFLGAGLPSNIPAWGLMVGEGQGDLRLAWWISFWPGLAIFLTVMSLNFTGDWLRDHLDPRLRQV